MAITNSLLFNLNDKNAICQGNWTVETLASLELLLANVAWPSEGAITVDGSKIEKMDSAGAWLLGNTNKELTAKGVTLTLVNFSKTHQSLISIVAATVSKETPPPVIQKQTWLQRIGKTTAVEFYELNLYLNFIGRLAIEMLRILKHPSHLRISSIAAAIYRTGYQALPIIALLSFMIGVVITFQMGLQLKNYGANIFIVDLLGLSILREFGPLITAIMVAGRTGSAYTAQLGMMKLNQEIDALDTLGVTPAEVLLLPRIIGLVIALPLLTIWANIFGVIGGMVMANNMLSITWYDFLHRFPTVIPLRALFIGIGKTPIFALLIASIGCFQGMQVEQSADSVGTNTTRSVVLSIFFIIVADAIFSVIFSKLKL